MNEFYTLGIDIGSTTAKLVRAETMKFCFNAMNAIFHKLKSKIQELLQRMGREVPGLAAAKDQGSCFRVCRYGPCPGSGSSVCS